MSRITKKTLFNSALAAFAATASGLALAEFYPQTEPTKEVFHIGIEGNYLWQSENTAQIESVGEVQNVGQIGTPLINETPGGSWGGGVDVGYRYSPRNDITASYFFLRADDTLNDTLPIYDDGGTIYLPEKNKLTRDFDSADILFGTYFKPSDRWLLRLGYGLGFARIAQTSKDSFNTAALRQNFTSLNQTTSENDFIGLGPKATLGADFKLAKHFYMIGELGLSVLYGKSKSKLSVSGIAVDGETVVPSSTYKQDNYQGALGFEGRIGAAYITPVSKNAALNVEAGFKGQSYVNALQDNEVTYQLSGLTTQVAPPIANNNVIDFDSTYSNFGPYINLSMDFK